MLELVLASQTQTYQSNEENQLIYLMTKSPVPWSAAETVWRRNRPAKWGLFLLTSHWATLNLWFLQFNPGRLEQAFNFQAELQDFYNGSTETKSPSGQGLAPFSYTRIIPPFSDLTLRYSDSVCDYLWTLLSRLQEWMKMSLCSPYHLKCLMR